MAAPETDPESRRAWDALKCQYPDAEYTTDGSWYRGSLRAGEDSVRSASLLSLVQTLRQQAG